jgi:hypothetical protein
VAWHFLGLIVAGLGIFHLSLSFKISVMFEFDQYLGFLAFLTILTIGFWLMMLLLMFIVPYWLGGNLIELWKERREAKRAKRNA